MGKVDETSLDITKVLLWLFYFLFVMVLFLSLNLLKKFVHGNNFVLDFSLNELYAGLTSHWLNTYLKTRKKK